MIDDFGQAARSILVGLPGDPRGASDPGHRAAHACEMFVRHLARLLGDSGVRLMLKRSVIHASGQFPWLAAVSTFDRNSSALRDTLAQQDPEEISEAFVAILTELVGLLERFIGEGLVERLLDEVWPGVFKPAAKDTV